MLRLLLVLVLASALAGCSSEKESPRPTVSPETPTPAQVPAADLMAISTPKILPGFDSTALPAGRIAFAAGAASIRSTLMAAASSRSSPATG
jgi:hypothetical protein